MPGSSDTFSHFMLWKPESLSAGLLSCLACRQTLNLKIIIMASYMYFDETNDLLIKLISVFLSSSDDLMSLLDAGVHVDDPSFVVDPEAIFSEDMFYSSQYGTIHRRPNSGARASRTAAEREADRDRERTREREALRRERDRWLGNIHAGGLDCGTSSSVPKQAPQDKVPPQSFSADPVSVADLLQWWQPDVVRKKLFCVLQPLLPSHTNICKVDVFSKGNMSFQMSIFNVFLLPSPHLLNATVAIKLLYPQVCWTSTIEKF